MTLLIRISFSVLFVNMLLLSSCTKKDTPSPIPTNNGTYLPNTANSTWHYQDVGYTNTGTITGVSRTINGITYYQASDIADTAGAIPYIKWFYQTGNKYYSVDSNSVISTLNPLVLKIIDLDLPIRTTWSTTFPTSVYSTATATSQVLYTGLNRTVNNINYKNVIAIQNVSISAFTPAYIASLSSIYTPAQIQELQNEISQPITDTTYYALGIGGIEDSGPLPEEQQTLLTYSIK